MNPVRDAIIIIGIIVTLAVVSSVARSSGNLTTSFNLTPSTPIYSSPSKEKREKAPEELTNEERQEQIEEEIEKAQSELALIEEELEEIRLYGEPSPYQGKVVMKKSAGSLRTTDVDREYIQLEAKDGNNERINITGWRIESSITGRGISIPEAVHLVFAGSSGSEQPVVLDPGDKAYITTGRSPIGPSFRVNKCSGYYTQFQNFTPSIRKICPLPEEEIENYTRDPNIFNDNECMDFVDSIGKCRIPTKALPLSLSFTCQEAIIDEINYNSCIDNHKDDADFRVPEWRIYLKRDTDLWRTKRELIKLLDENGKTVDHYSY